MRNKLLLILVSLIIISCNKDESCSTLDPSSQIPGYFLFPENIESYNFLSINGDSQNLLKNSFQLTEVTSTDESTVFGDSETCSHHLTAIYSSNDLGLKIENNIVIGEGIVPNIILQIKKDNAAILTLYDTPLSHSADLGIEPLSSFEINDKTYSDVLPIELEDTLGTIWISKWDGLIGIAIDGDTLSRQ